MLSTVTSYLIQKKGCTLPCIGEFRITTHSAEIDQAKNMMLPPVDEIVFSASEDSKISEDLVRFVARKKSIDQENAKLYLKNYCEEWKNTLLKNGTIEFKSFGTLQKNAVGNIFFKPAVQTLYKQPIKLPDDLVYSITQTEAAAAVAEQGIREHLKNKKPGKSFVMIALLLFLIAFAAILFHLYNTGFSVFNIVNHHKVAPASFDIRTISTKIK